MQINPILPQSPFTNRHHSLASSISRVPSLRRPSTRSPPISISRSSIDLQNATSYHRSRASPSSGLPQSSPIYSRLMSSYAPSISRSFIDVQNASYNRSHASPSLGLPQSSPINSRLISYVPSPNNASASNIVGSSSRLSYLHHYPESGASLSAMDSAQSLPECWAIFIHSNASDRRINVCCRWSKFFFGDWCFLHLIQIDLFGYLSSAGLMKSGWFVDVE